MRKNLTVLVLSGAACLAAPAQAATIAGLINTGVGASGSVDSNWSVNGGSAYVATQAGFPFPYWLANTAVSSWLTPASDQATSFDPTSNGDYAYTLSFDLTGYKWWTANFAAQFAVDNYVSSITLNGHTIYSGNGGGFTSWTDFSANSGFVNGVNTLTVNAVNLAQASGNPQGLRVEFLSSAVTAVPEASSWALMILGFGMVGAAMRRQRVSLRYS